MPGETFVHVLAFDTGPHYSWSDIYSRNQKHSFIQATTCILLVVLFFVDNFETRKYILTWYFKCFRETVYNANFLTILTYTTIKIYGNNCLSFEFNRIISLRIHILKNFLVLKCSTIYTRNFRYTTTFIKHVN